MNNQSVPQSLRNWFVIHFILDIVVAIPLMLAPEFSLKFLGWETVDPFSTRVAAAALFGIGTESYLGRNSGSEAYKGMLNLKIIWSASAVIGIGLSLLQGAQSNPPVAWGLLAIFVAFNFLWIYWRKRLAMPKI